MGKLLSAVDVTDVQVSVTGLGVIVVRVVQDKFSKRVSARVLPGPPTLRLVPGGKA
jgi:hypothetical protein